jgi:hypothetical protein
MWHRGRRHGRVLKGTWFDFEKRLQSIRAGQRLIRDCLLSGRRQRLSEVEARPRPWALAEQ